MVIAVDECSQCDVLSQHRFQCFVQVRFDFRVYIVTFVLNTVVGTDTYGLLIGTDRDNAYVGITELVRDQLTYLFRFDRIFELNLEVTSTGEVDTLAQTAGYQRTDTDQQNHACDSQPFLVATHKVEVCIYQHLLRDR